MTTPFIGEIRMFAGNYAPLNWHFCDGTLMSISTNDVLYSLIGTTYGGDGVNTFALPDLRSRVPLHIGTGNPTTYTLGQPGGTETVTLQTANLPSHSHSLNASPATAVLQPSASTIPAAAVTSAAPGSVNVYGPAPGPAGENLHPSTIAVDGQGLPHANIQPYLAVNFIIAMAGDFPPHP
jgi:microcystin-dependent protein